MLTTRSKIAFPLIKRGFAAAAEVAPKSSAEPEQVKTGRPPAKFQPELKVSRLANQLMVSSLDTNRATSRIAVAFKAGCRYEKHYNLGVCHRIAAQAGLASKTTSSYSAITSAGLMGANISYSFSRDLIIFEMDVNRDHVSDAMVLLGDLACRPALKEWELNYSEYLLEEQRKMARGNPVQRVKDLLHKAAYRSQGLGNSTHSPAHMIGKHSPELIMDYMAERFVAGEAGVVGENVDHEGLLSYCADLLPVTEGQGGLEEKAEFLGGEERRETGGASAHVIVAGEGPSTTNTKETAAFGVLSHCLGMGPVAPWSDFVGQGVLGEAIENVGARSVIFPHSDTGLCGIYFDGDAENIGSAVKSGVKALNYFASAPAPDTLLNSAKESFKTEILTKGEDSENMFRDLVTQTLIGEAEFTSPVELAQAVNSVTTNDVQQVAKKMSAKLAIGAVGNLYNTPYLDEIES